MKKRLSNFNYLFLFISIFIQSILSQNPIIVIPFKVNRIPNTKSSEFDTAHFIQEYFIRDFYTSLPTGIPSKNILTLLDTRSHLFLFGENYLNRNSLNEILDPEKIISKETYDKTKSHNFKNISRIHYSNIELKTATLCSEIFILYSDILMEKGKSISDVQFIINDDIQTNLHIRLGLGKPLTDYVGPPHFIQSLLNVGAIKDQSWTIKFQNKNGGLFILGEEPHKYEDITLDKRYQRKNYFVVESLSSKEYHNPLSIKAEDIFLLDKNNEEVSINKHKGCYLNYNNGFVTATKEYWDYIKKYFFAELFISNVCKEELIRLYLEQEDAYKSFYIISCDKMKLTEEDKKLLDTFPTLTFFIFDYNYNFELTKDDVFTEVNNVLYFMIIYQKDIFNNPELVYWDLGLPFLQKYQFVINYERKTIGFYIPEKEEEVVDPEEEEPDSTEKETTKPSLPTDNGEEEEDKTHLIIYITVGCIVGVLLLVGAFCLGKNLYKKRKTKANELEENFEYTSSNNKTKEKDEEGTIN
jgi:hypothetical protein